MTIDERPRRETAPRRGPRMTQSAAVSPRGGRRNYPVNCWYVAATSDEVGQAILGRRVADAGVAMYRTRTGEVVAFEDRCPHRAFPLSRGRLEGDRVVCGYHGFSFDASGRCVAVPSQEQVPYDARLTMLPVRESPPYIWVWVGDPARAGLRAPETVSWVSDPGWSLCGGVVDVEANYLLLLENFADVTHVPVVHPEISPQVLHGAAPALEIELAESAVWYSRDYPAAPLADWQASATGLAAGEYEQRESGKFVSPALWVDAWEVYAPDAAGERRSYAVRFAQAVTPVSRTRSRLTWRLGRDFAPHAGWVTASLQTIFAEYYARIASIAEGIQATIELGGPGPEFNVNADAAALQVRRIIAAMLEEEGSMSAGSRAPADRAV
jgi:vanillate O-demethylase monooxygenase subunit